MSMDLESDKEEEGEVSGEGEAGGGADSPIQGIEEVEDERSHIMEELWQVSSP